MKMNLRIAEFFQKNPDTGYTYIWGRNHDIIWEKIRFC